MRVVAVRAEQVFLLAIPEASALAVHSEFPVAQFRTMTLTAEPKGFLERDESAVSEVKFVALFCRVAIETPAIFLVVFEDDRFVVGHVMGRRVDVVLGLVAFRAREHILGEGRGSHGDEVLRCGRVGGEMLSSFGGFLRALDRCAGICRKDEDQSSGDT